MARVIPTQPLWMTVSLPEFPALDRDLDVDVLIVGAGVTGITTAYLLSQEGVKVALIEREKIATGESGRTTAHLTHVADLRLNELVSQFGNEAARTYWLGHIAAINTIESIVEETGEAAQFVRVPGYFHSPVRREPSSKDLDMLRENAELARTLGFEATFMDQIPYGSVPGVMFPNQAKFHPRRYFRGMLDVIRQQQGLIFENTTYESVEEGGELTTVRANAHRIRCKYLVMATHNPLKGKKGVLTTTLLQTKLHLYTTYVIGARLPEGTLPEALYWDTHDPYEYLRIEEHEDHQYAILGGSDEKTGQESDNEEVFSSLEQRLHQVLPSASVERRWLGQVIETDDGLPFIGENAPGEFIATGFAGNGYTLGTLSALMARDRYLGRSNPWSSLFDVHRKPFHGGTWRYVQENVDYPYYFIRDRLRRPEADSPDSVAPNEGKIVHHAGKKAAAYRDAAGTLTLLAPQCTHMKCLVKWNNADRTWDCPCHGSRFHPTGEVLSGPAQVPLPRLHE